MNPEYRQQQLVRIDTWLQKLHREHPLISNLIPVGVALLVISFMWCTGLLR
jgi:hypothetical protein